MGLVITPGQRIFIDTAPFIYFFEQHTDFGAVVTRLLDSIYDSDAEMISSLITYIEITTLPAKQGEHALVARYRSFFTNSERLWLQPIDLMVAEEAVRFRSKYGLRTPDALQWAAATVANADIIVTNDSRWQRIHDIPVALINELA